MCKSDKSIGNVLKKWNIHGLYSTMNEQVGLDDDMLGMEVFLLLSDKKILESSKLETLGSNLLLKTIGLRRIKQR